MGGVEGDLDVGSNLVTAALHFDRGIIRGNAVKMIVDQGEELEQILTVGRSIFGLPDDVLNSSERHVPAHAVLRRLLQEPVAGARSIESGLDKRPLNQLRLSADGSADRSGAQYLALLHGGGRSA